MRYTRLSGASIAAGSLLLLAALLFATARSCRPEPAGTDGAFSGEDLGRQVYAAECRSCHGQGEARGGLPPLRGHAVDLFLSPGGREYLVRLLLDGEVRRTVGGQEVFEEEHPSFGHLDDRAGAAVLNHMLTALGNEGRLPADASLYVPGDLARRRR